MFIYLAIYLTFKSAILLSVKEALEDLEQSEIRTMLLRLPSLNMEMVYFVQMIVILIESLILFLFRLLQMLITLDTKLSKGK